MKYLANAISNLASAINNLANQMNKGKDPSVRLNPTTTSNPYSGKVNITSTYVSSKQSDYPQKKSEGWFSLSSAEKEQLYAIYKAIIEKGINPNYHDIVFSRIMDTLHKEWLSLHNPIEKLLLLKEKSIKDVWKNKY